MSRQRELLNTCPRFRLLVVGPPGVGKSTLIRKVFGVEDVTVFNDRQSQADIEQEFIARDNKFFIVHDSIGFEAGENDNIDIIKHFISKRRAMKEIKDKLHAVWVVLPVPYGKRRLLEPGVERFLRERTEILGDIPVVVVLTKLDLLHQQLLSDMSKKGAVKSLQEGVAMVEQAKPKFLDNYCTKPLRAVAGDLPHVAVSAVYGFEATIPELVEITMSEIERIIWADTSHDGFLHVAKRAAPVSIEEKADLTIKLAKKRYGRNLGVNLTLSSKRISAYLLDIHRDIIQIWNFNDPDEVLQGDNFKAALLDDSRLGIDYNATPGILKSRHDMVKRFMAYISDLIYLMKILFILSLRRHITFQEVALSLKIYEKSEYRNAVHLDIRDFTASYEVPPGRDTVIEKIEEMTRRYSITVPEVAELRRKVQDETDDSTEQSNPPAITQVASEEGSDSLVAFSTASPSESDLPLLQQVGGRTMTMFMVLWSA